MKPEAIFYFAATHWDREWYKTVDEFRFMLVPVMDKVIETLEQDTEFALFTLDGQTCVLEDYLAVRPENAERLANLIRSGRLVIGPWYTMPDEFLTSAESLIQNLLLGHRIAKRYGAAPLKTGYICDTFGHAANLPQLLSGFGISTALISRGTNDSELECFFDWKAPDGSHAYTFKAPETCGYGSFYYEAISPFAPNYEEHLDEITELAIQYVERELTRTSLPYVLLMDGMDHEIIHPFMPQILKRLEEHFECPILQKRLDELPSLMHGSLPKRSGELASHGQANVMHIKLIPHTLSSRYDLKRANDDCQNLLEHYALPAAAICRLFGRHEQAAYLPYVYRLLLQNHAHDSICGCSIDAVHREMLTRFEKVQRTVLEYFRRFCEISYQESRSENGDCIVKLFSPLPYEYTGLLEFDIEFPPDFPVTSLPYIKYEQRNAFLIYDENGKEVFYNIVQVKRGHQVKMFGGNTHPADVHQVAVQGTLRPMGFTCFTIRPNHLPYRITDRFSTGPSSCRNDLIEFRIHPDGTVYIKDLETGQIYDHLHSFSDCCEAGDGWFHIRPMADEIISSSGCRVTIAKTFDGYAACRFLVRYELLLPREKHTENGISCRSKELVPYHISSEFTISRTSKLVTVRTEIENTVLDHRLQLHLPTGVSASSYFASQCELIVERPVGLDTSHYDWKECDITEYPFESMTWLRSDTRGLLFLSGGGLHEVSCPDDEENSIDITLLRCFKKTVGTNGETDGQLLGTHVFHYALLPLNEEPTSELVRIKNSYVAGFRAFTIENGRPSKEESAFCMESAHCVYSTCLPSETDGILLRFTNYSDSTDQCSVTFARPPKSAELCNFLEEKTADALVSGCMVSFAAKPYQLVTLHVIF